MIMTSIQNSPPSLPASGGPKSPASDAPRPGSGHSAAEIRQIVLDILG